MVYIQEAHPTDGWQLESNKEDDVLFAIPTSLPERLEVAQCCVGDLGILFPALVDDMDNTTDTAYTAWPERIYLVGRDGRMVYKSRPGPFGFDAEELGEELSRTFPTAE